MTIPQLCLQASLCVCVGNEAKFIEKFEPQSRVGWSVSMKYYQVDALATYKLWQLASCKHFQQILETVNRQIWGLHAGIILQDKLPVYEELNVQAGYLQLHMQLPARGSPYASQHLVLLLNR